VRGAGFGRRRRHSHSRELLQKNDSRFRIMKLRSTPEQYQIEAALFMIMKQVALVHAPMGAGKTLICLLAYQHLMDLFDYKATIITTKSILDNIIRELHKHFTHLPSINRYLGPKRRLTDAIITISTYDLMHELPPTSVLIFDEIHMLRNRGTMRYAKAQRLAVASEFVWGLSGTPLVNELSDLHATAELAGVDFTTLWLSENRSKVNKIPEKLPDMHIETFDAYPNADEIWRFRLNIEPVMHKLAKITKEKVWASQLESKCKYICRLLASEDDEVEEANNILVFSNYTTGLYILQKRILGHSPGYEVLFLTGEYSTGVRNANILRYQKHRNIIMLCTYGAGGVGINLTNTKHVVSLDPPWTSASMQQAIARAYRYGLKSDLHVHLLRHTQLEKRIDALIDYKSILMQKEYECEEMRPSLDYLPLLATSAEEAEAELQALIPPYTDVPPGV
jgi:SNF2 family DNA or RNA helicase